jgi:hypothetical protein
MPLPPKDAPPRRPWWTNRSYQLLGAAAVLLLAAVGTFVLTSGDAPAPRDQSAGPDGSTAASADASVAASDAAAPTPSQTPGATPSAPGPSNPPGVAVPDRPNCSSKPSSCGYPDATNTGVPAGTALTVHNGDLEITTAGQVVSNVDVRGCITVKAPNVTIRRSKVTCTDNYGIGSFSEVYSGGGLLVEDVEVDCANSGATAIGYYGLTARRVNLHGCENGFDIDNTTTVVDSYLHDMRPTDTGHTDGIQLAGGSNIVIRHNTIFNPGGTSAIISNPNKNSNVTIEANLLGGGAYTLYCPRDSSTNFRVINNRFSTLFSAKGGTYGPWDECQKVAENRGNVWDSTLAPVAL